MINDERYYASYEKLFGICGMCGVYASHAPDCARKLNAEANQGDSQPEERGAGPAGNKEEQNRTGGRAGLSGGAKPPQEAGWRVVNRRGKGKGQVDRGKGPMDRGRDRWVATKPAVGTAKHVGTSPTDTKEAGRGQARAMIVKGTAAETVQKGPEKEQSVGFSERDKKERDKKENNIVLPKAIFGDVGPMKEGTLTFSASIIKHRNGKNRISPKNGGSQTSILKTDHQDPIGLGKRLRIGGLSEARPGGAFTEDASASGTKEDIIVFINTGGREDATAKQTTTTRHQQPNPEQEMEMEESMETNAVTLPHPGVEEIIATV